MGNVSGSLVAFIPALMVLNLWWWPKRPALQRASGLVMLLLSAILFTDLTFGPFDLPIDPTVAYWLNRLMLAASAAVIFGYAIHKFVTDWRRATEKRRAVEAGVME